MGNPTEHLHDFITVEAPVGPGELLARAREKKRLSVQAIAEQLHLNVGIVQALEADDYDQLPPSTFVKGYLRGYANLVGVPEDDVLEAFRGLNGEDRHRPISLHTSHTVSTEINTAMLRKVTWLVALVLVVLVGLWARGHVGSLISRFSPQRAVKPAAETSVVAKRGQITRAAKPSVAGTSSASSAAPAAPESKAAPPVAEQNSASPTSSSSSSRASAPSVSEAAPEPRRANAPKAAVAKSSAAGPEAGSGAATAAAQRSQSKPAGKIAGVAKPTVASTGAAIQPVSEKPKVGAPPESASADGQSDAPQEAAPTPAAAGPELELQVAGPSWIEVTDNTGKRLVYQLVKGPADLKLHGVPPYSVSIGDTTQVKLSYSGQVVDLAPYTRQRVAHLQVPVSQ